MTNQDALHRIRENIEKHGFHLYTISGGSLPRWTYSIGLMESLGFELILAGASYFTGEQAAEIVGRIAEALRGGVLGSEASFSFDLGDLGCFSLGEVERCWIDGLMLGAVDYYRDRDGPVKARQVLVAPERKTMDVPNMAVAWAAGGDPAWKWLDEDWRLPVAKDSKAITNLNALMGRPVTEAVRWEEKEWEMFAGAGPDVAPDEVRVVPLATLLACDETLEAVVALSVGQGIWRDPKDLVWHRWERSD